MLGQEHAWWEITCRRMAVENVLQHDMKARSTQLAKHHFAAIGSIVCNPQRVWSGGCLRQNSDLSRSCKSASPVKAAFISSTRLLEISKSHRTNILRYSQTPLRSAQQETTKLRSKQNVLVGFGLFRFVLVGCFVGNGEERGGGGEGKGGGRGGGRRRSREAQQ